MAKTKTAKFPKNVVTIDRRTSKDRRNTTAKALAKKSGGKTGGEKTAKEKTAHENKLVAEKTTTQPIEKYSPKLERREKVSRRRQIDPTTCEREYSDDEVEFMQALDLYKRQNGRMFPTCSEVLEVIRGLGYIKASPGAVTNAAPEETFGTPVTAPSTGFESNHDFLPVVFEGAAAAVDHSSFG